jgi:glucose 1-dehydrogenase
MADLKGKVALITGASRGIGRGIALCMARAGADIVVNYHSRAADAESVADEIRAIGREALIVGADAGNREAVEQMFATAAGHFGHIDIVVANAAYSKRQPVLEADWETVRRTIEVAQFGVFHACQFGAQQMVRQAETLGHGGGKIIIIGSVHSEIAVPNASAYNMAKAAVNHLGRTLAIELAPHCINVNTINPGWIDTPGEREHFGDGNVDAGGQRLTWGRLGTPEDIGKMAVFLASDAADYVTGASIRVDGGFIHGLRLPDRQPFFT